MHVTFDLYRLQSSWLNRLRKQSYQRSMLNKHDQLLSYTEIGLKRHFTPFWASPVVQSSNLVQWIVTPLSSVTIVSIFVNSFSVWSRGLAILDFNIMHSIVVTTCLYKCCTSSLSSILIRLQVVSAFVSVLCETFCTELRTTLVLQYRTAEEV